MHGHDDIRIGTLVPAHDRTPDVVASLLPLGFESFQVSFGRSLSGRDLPDLARRLAEVLASHTRTTDEPPPRISALSVYGNALVSPETIADWETLIDAAADFGAGVVSGFAGRIPGRPVPESLSLIHI